VAASVIVTAVLTPILTAWVYRRAQKKQSRLDAQTTVSDYEQPTDAPDLSAPPIGAVNK
jgi:2-keto-3-deoxygluconate permease